MGIFKCKHKEYRVISCDKNERYYIVKCLKCGYNWKLPKAIGEEYLIGSVIRTQ